MKIIQSIKDMQQTSDRFRQEGRTIGFVPTMGYLHAGHLSLVRFARERADVVVMSIYVNPTQFGPNEDLEKYPRDFERDERLAQAEGVDIIFYPDNQQMYPKGYLTWVTVDDVTDRLCGASRPDHFRGVTTICTKLFTSVKPHFAVFGQKDYQQVTVIRRMVDDLNLDLEIITAPIIREPDGLAMSSRNVYLSPEERQDALSLYQAISLAQKMVNSGERNVDIIREAVTSLIASQSHTRVDYVEIVHPDNLHPLVEIETTAVIALAVFVGKTRLIDNCILTI